MAVHHGLQLIADNAGNFQGGAPDFLPTGNFQGGAPDFLPTGNIQGGAPDFLPTGIIQEAHSKRGTCPDTALLIIIQEAHSKRGTCPDTALLIIIQVVFRSLEAHSVFRWGSTVQSYIASRLQISGGAQCLSVGVNRTKFFQSSRLHQGGAQVISAQVVFRGGAPVFLPTGNIQGGAPHII